ncbi:Uncharacterised protein [Serratia quinivorans]|nr:Uncharacterised protein [Serratia quinivorans]
MSLKRPLLALSGRSRKRTNTFMSDQNIKKARARRAGIPWCCYVLLLNFYTVMGPIDNWLCRSITRYRSARTIN